MVNYEPAALDAVFGALADTTRRAIVARLAAGGELSVSALAEPFSVSMPAILKHLGVLDRVGLVHREKRGRTVYCRLEPHTLEDASRWLDETSRFWEASLDRLEDFLEGPP